MEFFETTASIERKLLHLANIVCKTDDGLVLTIAIEGIILISMVNDWTYWVEIWEYIASHKPSIISYCLDEYTDVYLAYTADDGAFIKIDAALKSLEELTVEYPDIFKEEDDNVSI